MQKLCFACDWVIKSFAKFEELASVSQKLDCGLASLGADRKSDNGFAVQTFGINVQTEAILDQFIEEIGAEIGLKDWYPITLQNYSQGIPFLWNEPIEERVRMVDTFIMLGKYNEQLQQKLGGLQS